MVFSSSEGVSLPTVTGTVSDGATGGMAGENGHG